jgi:hypothetical protein
LRRRKVLEDWEAASAFDHGVSKPSVTSLAKRENWQGRTGRRWSSARPAQLSTFSPADDVLAALDRCARLAASMGRATQEQAIE